MGRGDYQSTNAPILPYFKALSSNACENIQITSLSLPTLNEWINSYESDRTAIIVYTLFIAILR